MSKAEKPVHLMPLNDWERAADLYQAAAAIAQAEEIGFVYLAPGRKLSDLMRSCPRDFVARHPHGRVIVLSAAEANQPKDPSIGSANRDYAIEERAPTWRHLDLPEQPPDSWDAWLREQLVDWLDIPVVSPQLVQIVGSRIRLADSNDDASLFLVGRSPAIRKVIDALDAIKRRFRLEIGGKVGERRDKVLKPLDELLASENPNEDLYQAVIEALGASADRAAIKRRFSDARPGALPRVLILGPSGSGKSFVSRYLARRTSPEGADLTHRPLRRVPIPEYLDNEQRLEFELFGYMHGAYTDARQNGSPGVLLSHLGGIVFLDEIGDASPSLQAKLLAFMDDYRVTPRGWFGRGIHCPLMLVAATNRPVDHWAAQDELGENAGRGRFRHDLFQRFTHVIRLPGLNERKTDLPDLVDSLLQIDSVNAGRRVTGISQNALDALAGLDYARGNFRMLENLLRQACERAASRRTQVIQAGDIIQE